MDKDHSSAGIYEQRGRGIYLYGRLPHIPEIVNPSTPRPEGLGLPSTRAQAEGAPPNGSNSVSPSGKAGGLHRFIMCHY